MTREVKILRGRQAPPSVNLAGRPYKTVALVHHTHHPFPSLSPSHHPTPPPPPPSPQDHLWVSLSPAVRARVSALDISTDPAQLSDLRPRFAVGQGVAARILQVSGGGGGTGEGGDLSAPRGC